MITREQTDAKIAEIREADYIPEDIKQELIDEALTKEADQLEPGNVLAIVHAGVFGMILMGVLAVVKYSLIPLLLL